MEGENKNLLAAQALLMQVIAEVFLRYGEERRSPKKVLRNREAVKKAAAYIRNLAPENISLYDIAKVAGLRKTDIDREAALALLKKYISTRTVYLHSITMLKNIWVLKEVNF